MSLPTPGQLRAARAFLDWSRLDLARAARVSVSLVRKIETQGISAFPQDGERAIIDALMAAGIGFSADDSAGPCVRRQVWQETNH